MEDAVGFEEEVLGRVELGDRAGVHDAYAVVADDGSQTVWQEGQQRSALPYEMYVRAMHRMVRSLNSVAIVSWIFLSVS